jgi:hypothetical protein
MVGNRFRGVLGLTLDPGRFGCDLYLWKSLTTNFFELAIAECTQAAVHSTAEKSVENQSIVDSP